LISMVHRRMRLRGRRMVGWKLSFIVWREQKDLWLLQFKAEEQGSTWYTLLPAIISGGSPIMLQVPLCPDRPYLSSSRKPLRHYGFNVSSGTHRHVKDADIEHPVCWSESEELFHRDLSIIPFLPPTRTEIHRSTRVR
jgi:hypothetical protein